MAHWVTTLALIAVAFTAAPSQAAQQTTEEAVPPPVAGNITTSQMIRNAGYTLTDEEAAYLDADEQYTERFLTAVSTADISVNMVNEPAVRQLVMDQLRGITTLDPANPSTTPPASMQALNAIAQQRRSAIQRAARGWLEGLEANDPYWVNRGLEPFGQARQAEADWYAALRQRLVATNLGNTTQPQQQAPAQQR